MVTGLNRVISCKKQETYSDHRDLRLPRSAFRDLSEGGYQGINREATTAYWQNGLPILFSQIRPITFLSPVTVAALRGHVFVLERHILGPTWLAYDAHSGRHRTRIHPRSIAGFQIVNPPRLEAGTAMVLVASFSLSSSGAGSDWCVCFVAPKPTCRSKPSRSGFWSRPALMCGPGLSAKRQCRSSRKNGWGV